MDIDILKPVSAQMSEDSVGEAPRWQTRTPDDIRVGLEDLITEAGP